MNIRFPNIFIQLNDVPASLNISGFTVSVFGILLAVGMLLGLLWVLLHSKRRGENPNRCLGMFLFTAAGALIGARALYAAVYWESYQNNFLKIFSVREGGLSFYGALFGGILFGGLFCALIRVSFLEMADTMTMGVLITQIIARWGDLFSRCSFGEYTNNPLAMQLPLGSVQSSAVTDLMREKIIEVGDTAYIQTAPAFLYESAACLILFLCLLIPYRRKRFPGSVFFRYLFWYGLIRFGTEWIRTDKMLLPGTVIDVSLVISGALVVIFGITMHLKKDIVKKRASLLKEMRERYYQEEEKIAAEMDRKDAEAAAAAAAEGAAAAEEGKTAGTEVPEPGTAAEGASDGSVESADAKAGTGGGNAASEAVETSSAAVSAAYESKWEEPEEEPREMTLEEKAEEIARRREAEYQREMERTEEVSLSEEKDRIARERMAQAAMEEQQKATAETVRAERELEKRRMDAMMRTPADPPEGEEITDKKFVRDSGGSSYQDEIRERFEMEHGDRE